MTNDIAKRLDALEAEDERPQEQKQITVRAVIVQTFFSADGTRHERILPCTYDESAPFPAVAPGKLSVRNLWPVEHPELAGPYTTRCVDAQDVTGD
jgi:hypothetical protein